MGTCLPDEPGWREQDVELLWLVARGQANKQIAERLGVSVTAIKKRLSRVMRRLQSENRAQLVAAAFAHGLLASAQDPDGRELALVRTEPAASPRLAR